MNANAADPLPGLGEPTRPAGNLETAARETLAALAPELSPEHALLSATLLALARQIDRATASPRAKDYAVANLAAQLRDTLAALPHPEPAPPADAWTALENELRTRAG